VGDDLIVGVITPDERNHISLTFSGPAIGVGLMVATGDTETTISWALETSDNGDGDSATVTLSSPSETVHAPMTTSLSDILSLGTTQPPLSVSPTVAVASGSASSSAASSGVMRTSGESSRPIVASLVMMLRVALALAVGVIEIQ
jgi:hypothetical protein